MFLMTRFQFKYTVYAVNEKVELFKIYFERVWKLDLFE